MRRRRLQNDGRTRNLLMQLFSRTAHHHHACPAIKLSHTPEGRGHLTCTRSRSADSAERQPRVALSVQFERPAHRGSSTTHAPDSTGWWGSRFSTMAGTGARAGACCAVDRGGRPPARLPGRSQAVSRVCSAQSSAQSRSFGQRTLRHQRRILKTPANASQRQPSTSHPSGSPAC